MGVSYNQKALLLAKLDEDDLEGVASFDCVDVTEEELEQSQSMQMNEFIKNQAWYEQQQNLSVTFLVYHMGELVSYASICTDLLTLSKKEKQSEVSSPINGGYPSIKIARLAVDRRACCRGFGRLMVEYVRELCRNLSEDVGIRFITVDSYPAREGFYTKMGFTRNSDRVPNRNNGLVSMRSNIFEAANESLDTAVVTGI